MLVLQEGGIRLQHFQSREYWSQDTAIAAASGHGMQLQQLRLENSSCCSATSRVVSPKATTYQSTDLQGEQSLAFCCE